MNIPNHPETERLQLTKVLHALSDPLRLELVKQLAETTEKTCGTCADVRVAKSTLSHHFKVLAGSGDRPGAHRREAPLLFPAQR